MVASCVDIIVPIYNAVEEVKNCIDSVLRYTELPFNLILIDDASPDPDIENYLNSMNQSPGSRIQVYKNKFNLGFVGTVNRGMQMNNNNDVVLLNSDTIVTPDWLNRLRRCAASDHRIGTITPFSNNAEICSFPEFCQPNPVPENVNLTAQAIAETDQPIYPEIPTAVGFCMYITRALLDVIGNFDEQAFGRGYGEENDFCRRAVKASYRNVLCDDAYVLHVGSCSFGDEKKAHCERNMQVLLSLHPDYMEVVSEFIAQDPIKPIREAAKARLEHSNMNQYQSTHQLTQSPLFNLKKLIENFKSLF